MPVLIKILKSNIAADGPGRGRAEPARHEPPAGEDRPVLDQADRGDHCQRRQEDTGSGGQSQEKFKIRWQSQETAGS
jgi:hypothetical protein